MSQCHYWYGNLADYRTGNYTKCCDGVTGKVTNFAVYCADNCLKHHDSITGTVAWPITVPVMIQSVTMALPVW